MFAGFAVCPYETHGKRRQASRPRSGTPNRGLTLSPNAYAVPSLLSSVEDRKDSRLGVLVSYRDVGYGRAAWAFVVCILIPLVWTIPIGIVQAITNIQLGLNVLTEFVVGYMLPGHPDDQPNGYSCPGGKVFYTASIIWGAIGPALITWFLARRYPKSLFRYVNVPLIFGGAGYIPPATAYNDLCWGAVGMTFNYFIRRRWTPWWLQYNYVTSVVLDCGLVVSTIIIFFTLYLTSAQPPQWFGNVQVYNTLDQTASAIKSVVADGETFGPASWP
ncbi:Uu.00g112690.m01.CDS01 [Anthostomella pinea]|uniref:Uu.00g112690.m01.CDS01 n=1 Tax=Anthostomella pinea TaxID=933095 RepID=A0AAI8VFC3_9PEZI|nr:Uu.00g112690.m01.CDS01 [Anthostomella pinea]